jgi:hypothetical protein
VYASKAGCRLSVAGPQAASLHHVGAQAASLQLICEAGLTLCYQPYTR